MNLLKKVKKSEVAIVGKYFDSNGAEDIFWFERVQEDPIPVPPFHLKADRIKRIARIHKNDHNTYFNAKIEPKKIGKYKPISTSKVVAIAIKPSSHSLVNLYYSIYEHDWYANSKAAGDHVDLLANKTFIPKGRMKYEDDVFIWGDNLGSAWKFDEDATYDKPTLHDSLSGFAYSIGNSNITVHFKK